MARRAHGGTGMYAAVPALRFAPLLTVSHVERLTRREAAAAT